ncbi:MAG: flagellar basal body-associated FliL family protein [Dehalococcoidia bacterium]
MKRGIVLAVGGAVAGISVAFGLFVFVLGGAQAGEAPPEAAPTPVHVSGRLGPHIVLADRVFNLQSDGNFVASTAVYLKLQTVIEFETTSEAWAHVLHGCVAASSAPATPRRGLLVSAHPGGAAAPLPSAAEAEDPCAAEEQQLLEQFEREIGSGRQLIEDAVTTVVSGHTAAEISTPGGKEALKAEIRAAVAELITEPRVTRVLFTNFITQ